MWIANRIETEIEIELAMFIRQPGIKYKVKMEIPEVGVIGAMLVFKTKTAARKYYGRNIKLVEVR